jgi:hypothetical protein
VSNKKKLNQEQHCDKIMKMKREIEPGNKTEAEKCRKNHLSILSHSPAAVLLLLPLLKYYRRQGTCQLCSQKKPSLRTPQSNSLMNVCLCMLEETQTHPRATVCLCMLKGRQTHARAVA